MQMGAGMPMHMGAVPLDQNDGSISQNLYNGRGNYRLLTIDLLLMLSRSTLKLLTSLNM